MIRKCGTKVSVIGAAGAVGATVSYVLSMSGNIDQLVLVDIAKDKVEGEALDLNHGSAFINPIDIKAGNYKDTRDSDIVIITAGIPQKPNQSRIELVKTNVEVIKSIVPEVVNYSPNCIILVISNPVDILSYVAYKLSGFPKERVIGSGTLLDTSRFKYEIGKRFRVDPRDVDSYILGEHGDTSFPAWSLTNIKSIPISEYAKLMNVKYDDDFKRISYENVRQAAYEVINKKNATYYAIALSVNHIVNAILKDMRCILPVSSLIDNYYDADDIYMGVPCIIGRNGVEEMLKVSLNEKEVGKLNISATKLKAVLEESFKLT